MIWTGQDTNVHVRITDSDALVRVTHDGRVRCIENEMEVPWSDQAGVGAWSAQAGASQPWSDA